MFVLVPVFGPATGRRGATLSADQRTSADGEDQQKADPGDHAGELTLSGRMAAAAFHKGFVSHRKTSLTF
jgi:hypothetical protein